MSYSFRYRAGVWSASDMTEAYAVVNWPIQSDQRHFRWWVASPSEMAREYDTLITDTLDKSTGAQGYWNLYWLLAVNTADMLTYARATMFPTTGPYAGDGLNQQATIVTRTPMGWKCLNLWARYTEPADVGESRPRDLALLNWRINFDTGTEADSGGEYDTSEYDLSEYNVGGIPT